VAPGIDSGRTFRRSLSARVVSFSALVLFGLAVATRTVSGDFGAGYYVLAALVLVSIAGVVSAWGDRITIDAAGVETRNAFLARLPGLGERARRRLAWADILRVQEHRRPGSDLADLPRALFLVPLRGRRLALDSLEDFDAVVTLVRRNVNPRLG
jgi:hypothetical protein